MTTESGADSEAKQPQDNKETEKKKTKAAADSTPLPEQLPAAVGHSTPAKKEQVRSFSSYLTKLFLFTFFFAFFYFCTMLYLSRIKILSNMFTFRFSLLKVTITFTTEKICFYEREKKKCRRFRHCF